MKNRTQTGWRRSAVLGLLALAFVPAMASSLAAQRVQTVGPNFKWHKVNEGDGIKVYAKDHPDRDLPTFRGVGEIEASVQDIVAVLFDVSHQCEWVLRCAEARVLKQTGEAGRIVYSRTSAPWPVSDRDMVVQISLQYDPKSGKVRSPFKSLPSYPGAAPVDGVVRMTRMSGYYFLEPVSENRTRVTFEVDADPGGALPTFIVKWASQSIPIDQLNGLRKQVKKLGADARERVAKWNLWSKGGAKPAQTASAEPTPAAPAKPAGGARQLDEGAPAADKPGG